MIQAPWVGRTPEEYYEILGIDECYNNDEEEYEEDQEGEE